MFVLDWFRFSANDYKTQHSKLFCHTLQKVQQFQHLSWQQYLKKCKMLQEITSEERKTPNIMSSPSRNSLPLPYWVHNQYNFQSSLKRQKQQLKECKMVVDLSRLPLWAEDEWRAKRPNVYEPVSSNIQVIYVTNMRSYPPSYPPQTIRVVPESMLYKKHKRKNKNKRKRWFS